MKIVLLSILLCTAAFTMRAQSITTDTLRWTATHITDKKNNTPAKAYASTFDSFGNQKVDWKQGVITYHYSVTATSGSWTSLSTDGSVEYTVSCGTYVTGTITFKRQAGQLTVHLETRTDGNPDLDLIFTISTVEPLQP